ncbi:hypothetical protein AB7M37_003539 [Sinorhizobium fredii]
MMALSGVRRSCRNRASASAASSAGQFALSSIRRSMKTVQLGCCSADPLEVGQHMVQAEVSRLFEQQFLKAQDRLCGAGHSLCHMGGEGLTLEFVSDAHFSNATQ